MRGPEDEEEVEEEEDFEFDRHIEELQDACRETDDAYYRA